MTMTPSYVVVWALLVFAWITNYLVRMGFSALLPPIMQDFDLSYTRGGLLAAGFFYAYAVIQLPAGFLGDRFGRRRVLIAGLLAGSLGSVATALSTSFGILLTARVLTGAGQGTLFSNDRAIIASVTPHDKLALGQAVSFMGPGLGTTLGLLLAGMLGEFMGWRWVFLLFALAPVLAALLIFRWVPPHAPAPVRERAGDRLRSVLSQSDLWVLGLSGATVMYVQYVLLTWAPQLFLDAGVREIGRAGLYSSLVGLAAATGLVAGGVFGDRARRHGLGHKVVIAASFAATTASMLALARVIQSGYSIGALTLTLLFASFCIWSVWGPSFALLGELFGGKDLGTAFGLYNGLTVLGAVVGPFVTGWTRDATGSFVAGCYLGAAVAATGALVAMVIRPAFRLIPPRPSLAG